MKKLLFSAFFLCAASATGFSQNLSLTIVGKPTLAIQGEGENKKLVLFCRGEGTCAIIYDGPGGGARVKIPDLNRDFKLAPASAGEVKNYPPIMPNGDYVFAIEED